MNEKVTVTGSKYPEENCAIDSDYDDAGWAGLFKRVIVRVTARNPLWGYDYSSA